MGKLLFFLGKSGVGKTTIMEEITKLDSRFLIPRITVTRARRPDDKEDFFCHMGFSEYEEAERKAIFILSMKDGTSCYGYQRDDVVVRPGFLNLLYGSPAFLSEIKKMGVTILVDGDDRVGLTLRNEPNYPDRINKNLILDNVFYGNYNFRAQMGIIVKNDFQEPPGRLAMQIVEKLSLID